MSVHTLIQNQGDLWDGLSTAHDSKPLHRPSCSTTPHPHHPFRQWAIHGSVSLAKLPNCIVISFLYYIHCRSPWNDFFKSIFSSILFISRTHLMKIRKSLSVTWRNLTIVRPFSSLIKYFFLSADWCL